MPKQNITLSVESDIYQPYLDIIGKGNVSSDIEEYMKLRANIEDLDTNKTRVLIQELSIIEEKKKQIDLEFLKVKKAKENAERIIQDKQIKELETEKEKLSKLNKCINCGQDLSEVLKKHKFTNGSVCNSCFLNANAESYKRWNNG